MTKEQILLNLIELHNASIRHSHYTKIIEDEIIPEDKKIVIKQWADDELKHIKEIQNDTKIPLKKMFYEDVYDKYLINISTYSSSYNYIMLIHITDVYFKHKGSPYFKYDLVYGVNGEFAFGKFDKAGNTIETSYYKEIDEFDEVGPYLTTNHFYNLISEGLNGWKEISKDYYGALISSYKQYIDYDYNTLENNASLVKLKVPGDKEYNNC